MPKTRLLLALAVLAAVGWPAAAPAADLNDEVAQTAVLFLQDCLRPRQDNRHLTSLGALRHLTDPELEPLFRKLLDADLPAVKVHAYLGLAECNAQKQLDLAWLAKVKDPAFQAEIISAAMDCDLLDTATCKAIYAWPDLDLALKVILAAPLVKEKQFTDLASLHKATESDKLARRALAAVLLLQLGDGEAQKQLQAVYESSNPERDAVCDMVLLTAERFQLDRIGPWALRVAKDRGPGNKQGLKALQVALRFGQEEAAAYWQQQFVAATDLPQRTRLGLLGLELAPWLKAEAFAPLLTDKEPLLRQIGKTAQAVAKKDGVAQAVGELVALHHPVADGWALRFAKSSATDADAAAILTGLIAASVSTTDNEVHVGDEAVFATAAFWGRNPQAAKPALQAILRAPTTDSLLQRAILLGLATCRGNDAASVLEGLPPFKNSEANAVAAFLLAKSGQPLTDAQMKELVYVVRGAAEVSGLVRLQASWLYLKRMNLSQAALAKLLSK